MLRKLKQYFCNHEKTLISKWSIPSKGVLSKGKLEVCRKCKKRFRVETNTPLVK